MLNKIAVIGDADSVLAFKAIGLDVFSLNNFFEVKDLLKKLAKDYPVIFVTEEIAISAAETIEKYKSKCYPAIIPIPSNAGTSGFGINGVKADVEKAIGADIIFK